jgi:propionate CoA-transferase
MKQKTIFCTADEAVSYIQDGWTLSSLGFRYAGTPEALLSALGGRHKATGRPSGLTLVFSSSQGNSDSKGLDNLAEGNLLRRIIGGFYGVTPALVSRITGNEIAAYNWPQGVMARLFHAIAAGQPGVVTRIGLHTFIDPRQEGGRLNALTQELLSEVVRLNGQEYLLYRSFPIHACFIRATSADRDGNLSCEKEAIKLEMLPLAMATRNSGGLVIAQVERVVSSHLPARQIEVPGHLVNMVVECKNVETDHRQCVNYTFNPEYNGDITPPDTRVRGCDALAQLIIAKRAAAFLHPGDVINLGSGIPETVADVLRCEMEVEEKYLTVESGINGGILAIPPDFGLAFNPDSIIRQDDQFNFYQGGGLDCALLGFAEIDAQGNVNVSRFGGKLMGCGGFIDIAQSARRVIFCGTFNSKGLEISMDGGNLTIKRNGTIQKLVERVGQITFNGSQACREGKDVYLVTERCVMHWSNEGWALEEIAPGIDIAKDITSQMRFRPIIPHDVKTMDSNCFVDRAGILKTAHA